MRTESQQAQGAGQNSAAAESARRSVRVGVEMPVRGKAGLMRSTFLLKDLTRQGARIAGIGMQRVGEPITLLLPGASRATIAFVMWANESVAGLEFLDPLDEDHFTALVADYAIGQMPNQGHPTDRAPMKAPATATTAMGNEPRRFAA